MLLRVLSPIHLATVTDLDYFFPLAEGVSGGSNGTVGGVEHSLGDFSMDDESPQLSRGNVSSQRSSNRSNRSSNHSTRRAQQPLFVQAEESDNDLAFD